MDAHADVIFCVHIWQFWGVEKMFIAMELWIP